MSRWTTARVVGSLSAASLLAAAVAFVSNILAARTLGPELRGEVAFALQVAYFLGPLLIFGSDRAVLRGDHLQKTASYHVAGRRLILGTSLIALVVALTVAQGWHALLAPMSVTVGWFLLRRAYAIHSQRPAEYIRPFVAYQALILASHLLLAALQVTAWPAWAAAYAAPALVLLMRSPTPPSLSTASPIRNTPFMVAALTQMWSMRGERLLLPLLANPAQLGLYVVVATATEPFYWVAQAAADQSVGTAPPRTNRARLLRLGKLLVIFTPMAVAMGLGLTWVIEPIFGESFSPATVLVLPLAIAAVVLALYRQVSAWVLAGAQPGAQGRVEALTAITATFAYPTGIVIGQAEGAAWATVAVYTLGTIIGLAPTFHRTSKRANP